MSRRMHGTVSVVIDRSPDEVFDYLRDPTRHGEWSPRPYRAEGVDGPVEQGATFTSFGWVPGDAEHRNEVEVTGFDPPTLIEFTAKEQGENFLSTYRLSPQGSGTKVDKILDMPRPGGVGGLMFPVLFAGFIKPATRKGLRMLKDRLESKG